MLKGHSGCSATGAGWLLAGASQASSVSSASRLRSRAMVRGKPPMPACPASNAVAASSAKSSRACASRSIEPNCSDVTDGASGATATPARNAPRNTSA